MRHLYLPVLKGMQHQSSADGHALSGAPKEGITQHYNQLCGAARDSSQEARCSQCNFLYATQSLQEPAGTMTSNVLHETQLKRPATQMLQLRVLQVKPTQRGESKQLLTLHAG